MEAAQGVTVFDAAGQEVEIKLPANLDPIVVSLEQHVAAQAGFRIACNRWAAEWTSALVTYNEAASAVRFAPEAVPPSGG